MKFTDEQLEHVTSYTTKTILGCGNFYDTIDLSEDGDPCRTFLKLGKAGGCQRVLLESIARLLTIILQDTDVPLERVYKTLCGMSCDKGSVLCKSCMDKLAQELKQHLPKEDENEGNSISVQPLQGDIPQ